MSAYTRILPLIAAIVVSVLFSAGSSSQGFFDDPVGSTRAFGRNIDPTDPESETRAFGRNIDPTNPKGYVGSRTRGVMNLANPAATACVANGEVTYNRNRTRARRLSSAHAHWLRKAFGDLVDRVVVRYDSLLNDGLSFQGRRLILSSEAQTYGYNIYVSGAQRPDSTGQLLLLVHEFEHVRQYERAGEDLLEFCSKYMGNYFRSGGSYASNPMEFDAYRQEFHFAEWLARQPKIKRKAAVSDTFHYKSSHPDIRRSGVDLPYFL